MPKMTSLPRQRPSSTAWKSSSNKGVRRCLLAAAALFSLAHGGMECAAARITTATVSTSTTTIASTATAPALLRRARPTTRPSSRVPKAAAPPPLECFDAESAGCDWDWAAAGHAANGEHRFRRGGIPGGWKGSHTGSSDHQFPWLATIVSLICLFSVIFVVVSGMAEALTAGEEWSFSDEDDDGD